MRKYKRHLPLILSGLAAIALGSVGFSTWIFVYQSSSSKVDGVNVEVETTKYSTLDFKASLVPGEDKLYLNGGNSGADSLTPGIGSTGEPADLDIKVKLDFYITKTFVELHDVTHLNIEFLKNEKNYVKTDVINKRSPMPTEGWTYVDLATTNTNIYLPTDITTGSTVSNMVWTSALTDTSKEEYKLSTTVDVKFNWGSYFDKSSPIEFYNNKAAGIVDSELLKQHYGRAGDELNTMQTSLNSSTGGNPFELKLSLDITNRSKA